MQDTKIQEKQILSNQDLESFLKKSKNWSFKYDLGVKLPLVVLDSYPDLIIWDGVSSRKDLSEDFVRNNKSKLRLLHVVKRNIFTGEFLEEILDLKKLKPHEWANIWRRQNITLDFVKNHLPFLQPIQLQKNKNLKAPEKKLAKALYFQYKDLH